MSTGVAVHLNKEGSSSGSDAELELNLKLDEVENRHSTMGKYQQNSTHLNRYNVKVWVKFERKKLKNVSGFSHSCRTHNVDFFSLIVVSHFFLF